MKTRTFVTADGTKRTVYTDILWQELSDEQKAAAEKAIQSTDCYLYVAEQKRHELLAYLPYYHYELEPNGDLHAII